uniref:Uncharacterized protein n=1 Tax=Hippocampus comes TaxID=109280 RepID=A0A3Q2XLV8_HIPCM
MPSPSDSSSVASASGSRGWSDSRRGFSGRGPGGARLLLYLGLCHLSLGAMVLAFSFTSMAFTSSARVRQSCPFWAGFFVSINPTWDVSLFMLLSAVCVILSLAGSMLSCQNAQMVKSMLTCEIENGRCVCCVAAEPCSSKEDGTLVLNLNSDCHSVRHQLKVRRLRLPQERKELKIFYITFNARGMSIFRFPPNNFYSDIRPLPELQTPKTSTITADSPV